MSVRKRVWLKEKTKPGAVPSHSQVVAHRYDGLAGLFTAILMQLQAASDLPMDRNEVRGECFLHAENLARQGLREARELVEMSALVDVWDEGALMEMRTLVDSVAHQTSAICTFTIRGGECPLKISAGVTLQRILQEALTNAQRYANAKTISVQLCFEEDRVILEITDDGRGFVPDQALSSGFGLIRMRARIDRLGGGLWLRSSPGEGTHIRVDLPNPYPEG